ncbi:Der1-like family-domain-containing protein [Aspergillus ambiguus]|uniref:Der1-like family-domain-containing protein n=1 Tax=Aspergillus ambiguus TaxID=176160 RepID=UPI003CCD50D8
MDVFWSAPPVSRTLTALAFCQSALVYGGLLSGYHTAFLPRLLFRLLPQAWRLITPFLLTRPSMAFVFDLYFLYTYSSRLESNSPRFTGPGDFFTYVIFVASVILLTAGCVFNGVFFTHALILAFVYTFAQDNRGSKASFFMIRMPIEFLPWAMLVFTLVAYGCPAACNESMGIVAAHLYDFLTRIYPTFGGGRNYITTPAFVRRLFSTTSRGTSRGYGTAYRPASQDQGSSGGWTSSFQGAWSQRGPGRRLGGG